MYHIAELVSSKDFLLGSTEAIALFILISLVPEYNSITTVKTDKQVQQEREGGCDYVTVPYRIYRKLGDNPLQTWT